MNAEQKSESWADLSVSFGVHCLGLCSFFTSKMHWIAEVLLRPCLKSDLKSLCSAENFTVSPRGLHTAWRKACSHRTVPTFSSRVLRMFSCTKKFPSCLPLKSESYNFALLNSFTEIKSIRKRGKKSPNISSYLFLPSFVESSCLSCKLKL